MKPKLTILSQQIALVLLAMTAVPSMAQEQEANDSQDIEIIEVQGRAQQFYLDSNTRVGTKTDANILDIPMSIQVITKQLIIDQAARDITDLYRSIAGVSEFSYSGVTFRGFRDSDSVFYDGVRGDTFSGFSVPQVFNVERIEVLKGPSAALYGGGEPGGMINYVTKKPTFTEKKELNLSFGSDSLAGGSLDFTGGLTENIAYRLGGFYESQESFRVNADSENIQLVGGLLFELSADTSLYTTFDYIEQNLGGNRLRGVPVDDNGNFIVERSYNANEAFDYQNLEALSLQANLTHNFSDNFDVNATVRYMDNDRYQSYHESYSWVDVNGDGDANIDDQYIKREYRKQYRANEEISFTVDFVYEMPIMGMEHQILFGGDYHDVETEFDNFGARYEADGVKNLNIFNPNYGETDPSTYNLQDLHRDGALNTRSGFYVQDMISLTEQWTFMVGARFDKFEETNKQTDTHYDDSDVSYRTGLTYKPSESLSVYMNYSESFDPVSANNFEKSVGQLEPTTGEQIEIGAKKEWFDGRILTTFALYHIDKENLVMGNPDYHEDENPNVAPLINYGLVESKGFEFTMVGDITEFISLTANYANNKTEVIEGETRNRSGSGDFVNAPEHQAGLWARYDIANIDSSFAFGIDYVSEQISYNDQKVKAYTVFDASWTTRWNSLLLSVNVNNIFDKEYAVSGFSERNGHFPGQPREVIGQITYNF
ncbi:MAG: iron complex outermembrane receptor protein [Cellvibrionaceae bacterium]|jgi:iron complex outermembrane receptor protein